MTQTSLYSTGETISRDTKSRDTAEESRYFTHGDHELLVRLSRKVKRHADARFPDKAKIIREKEERESRRLVPNVNDGDLKKNIDWLHKDGTGVRA